MAIPAFIELVRANQSPRMLVAEVGVWAGDSAAEWVPIVHQNNGVAVLVDNFMGSPTVVGTHAHTGQWRGEIRSALLERLKGYPSVLLLESDSAAAAAQLPDESLDLCFIDADHRYSFVRRDIEAWRTKVKSGGILAGHDYEGGENFDYDEPHIETDFVNGKHHGVIKALKELLPQAEFLADTCWFYRLP